MSLRRQKHLKIPVWIRLRHLPMEYWTEDGLSVVASGIGILLYADKITKSCLRLDYARVCVMLDYHSTLPRHLIVLSPNLREGSEVPLKIDVEYEWLPQRCKQCCSLGHKAANCPNVKVQGRSAPVAIFVQKKKSTVNVPDLADTVDDKEDDVDQDFYKPEDGQMGPGQTHFQPQDYSGPGGRIWLAWNALEIDVDIVRVEVQFIHCKVTNRATHTSCLISIIYGECDSIRRRELWSGLCSLAEDISDDPWCILGDFNAIVDSSEACGRSVDSSHSMTEFHDCICATALVHLPFTGCPFTWHNCSEGSRSLWKRLDRVLVNETWLVTWPQASYVSALPSTSDHSPAYLKRV
ncbi:UNVERIFIED_CONTAM: hypothetical protein Slati_2448600 [Sesamum latifolium]|uniref:Endonuclease/exonuclease/phosphatase domain-containing protein n=1 Tax=Sesamum latifolium TaxID=2727402 RepID=A0AAW2WEK2_9LAMI